MGSHQLTQNLELNNYSISNDGGVGGLSIDSNENVNHNK